MLKLSRCIWWQFFHLWSSCFLWRPGEAFKCHRWLTQKVCTCVSLTRLSLRASNARGGGGGGTLDNIWWICSARPSQHPSPVSDQHLVKFWFPVLDWPTKSLSCHRLNGPSSAIFVNFVPEKKAWKPCHEQRHVLELHCLPVILEYPHPGRV